MLPAPTPHTAPNRAAVAHPIHMARTTTRLAVDDWLSCEALDELQLRLEVLVDALRHPGLTCEAHDHHGHTTALLVHPDQRTEALAQLHHALDELTKNQPALNTDHARRLTGDR